MDVLELNPFGPVSDPFIMNIPASISPSPYNTCRTNTNSTGDEFMKRKRLFLSAGIASSLTSSFYNPLDCLRVRWQTLYPSSTFSSQGIVNFTRHIISNEGFINGLWRPGVTSNALGMASSSALRFGYYETVRDALHNNSITGIHNMEGSDSDLEQKNGMYMFIAGLSCGAVAYFITTPFHLVKTKSQAEMNNYLHQIGKQHTGHKAVLSRFSMIVKEEGLQGLYRGCTLLSLRGAFFTAGQLVGYDGFKTICKSNDILNDGVPLHVVSSIAAALGATVLSTPADYVMSRYMSSNTGRNASFYIIQIYNENGILGFWKGSGIGFLRVCPVMLSYTTIYEQLRLYFGLGYLS